jgi:hypothetical protein
MSSLQAQELGLAMTKAPREAILQRVMANGVAVGAAAQEEKAVEGLTGEVRENEGGRLNEDSGRQH